MFSSLLEKIAYEQEMTYHTLTDLKVEEKVKNKEVVTLIECIKPEQIALEANSEVAAQLLTDNNLYWKTKVAEYESELKRKLKSMRVDHSKANKEVQKQYAATQHR